LPLLISPEDWGRIEKGLSQRSRLFNLILADLYGGGQRLLRNGFLPPEFVYGNPGFLRPCRGIAVPRQVYLHLQACDVARSADGQWWVLSDRTQAPSGAGYALENRTVISRVLPDEIRDRNVQRLADFFRAEREMLFELAPGGSRNPNAVLLTPGPHNETYFEHAYLARYLGFPLVEGGDLTVRDQRVFLKTLEGLQPVDVILRRVDDSFCDPLELRGESFLGVPGLVEAARAGHVALANALGSGLMETPAFLAFLPGLCRHLLGEELLLPSVATWWCGQADELRYVLEHLDRLVVKPAFSAPTRQPWFGGRLSAAERDKLVQAIRSRPRDFVGQERVVLSRAPVWVENHFEARSVVVRTYVANGGDRTAVLPGGLTRVSRTTEDPVVSMQSGGGSKDTWVLAPLAAPVPDPIESGAMPVVETSASAEADRSPAGTPSRAADNLYWLGRYTERLEQTLRVLRCVIGRMADEPAGQGSTALDVLAELMARLNLITAPVGPVSSKTFRVSLQQQVLALLYKPRLAGGAGELLGRIRFIVSTVRDRFSGDTWRILGRLELDARTRPGRLPLANALELIHHLVLDLAAFNGMEMENMTRGHGWRFLDLGRRLERALSITNLVRSALRIETKPSAVLEPVLEMADSVMTYRRRYYAEARLPGVLELLLREESNPRSLHFQVAALHEHFQALTDELASAEPNPGIQRVVALRATMSSTDWDELAAEWMRGRREALLDHLENCGVELVALSDELTSRYFSHTLPRVS
jgi:uncharacterized circularly permuted ATP-grasp superfamily protein/uncharacterized alpha-E superfamily protein